MFFIERNLEIIESFVLINLFNGIKNTQTVLSIDFIKGVPKIKAISYQSFKDYTIKSWQSCCFAISNIAAKILTKLDTRNYVYTENTKKIDIKYRDKNRKMNRIKTYP